MIGNSFSSYVRDYDFSVVLPQLGCGVGENLKILEIYMVNCINIW